jgi:hypothetical protein
MQVNKPKTKIRRTTKSIIPVPEEQPTGIKWEHIIKLQKTNQ